MPPKKKNKTTDTYDSYPIKILSWIPSSSVSLNKERRLGVGPYSEHHSINIQGELLGPEKVAGRKIDVTLIADRWMSKAMTSDDIFEKDPLAIGGISSRGNDSNYLGSIPFDIFPAVLSMLAAGKYNYLSLHGKSLRYGKAAIEYLRFEEELDPDEI
ncbi:hypothetical protein [Desulfuromonas sp.]|uniref:hypothetical protein n=1 Tax=Desulfuromonas sp. TaxID=892 RepID=UPI0025BF9E6D|nr:hypothetical protein [Desulfuromonas sp.]